MPDDLDRQLRLIARSLVEEAPSPPPFPERMAGAPARRRRRPLLAVVATVAVCGAAVVAVVMTGSSKHSSTIRTGPAASGETPSTAAPGPPFTCGAQPPRELSIPSGYVGPTPGPSPQASATPSPGQLVVHWASASGSIELRWPPDPTAPNPYADSPSDGLRTSGDSGAFFRTMPTTDGGAVAYAFWAMSDSPAPACRIFEVAVFDGDPSRVDAVMDQWRRRPFVSHDPLIRSSETRDALPPVTTCRAPAGITPPPNTRGGGEGATYPRPADALQAFVDTHPNVMQRNYLEMRLPDGSIAYGAQVNGLFVTLVQVVPTAGGWSISYTEESGC